MTLLGRPRPSTTAVRHEVAEPSPPPARTLCDVFSGTVARWPRRPAVHGVDRVLSYEELHREVRQLADRLWAAGIGRGERVGVRVPSGSADLAVAVLGILHAGAAYVPVDEADPDHRAERIWEEARVGAVVGADLSIEPRPRGRGPGPLRHGAPAPEDDCWVIFTSGSTGAPKGVAVSHRSAAAFVDAEATLWQVHPDDRVLAGLSVAFDASCEEMWLAWRNGATLVPCPRAIVQSGLELGPWIRAHEISVVSTVPTLASMWAEETLVGVRLVILGGEACPEQLGCSLARFCEVWNTYGPTEATVVSTATRVEPGRPVTIGRPLPGWRVAVVDAQEEPVEDGGEGELVIAGVGLGRYLDPGLDAVRYAPLPSLGWDRAYRTGDVVRNGPDGFEFVGRRDDQVKIGGRRIELAEIDTQLRGLPGVRAAVTSLRRLPGGNRILVGYVVGDVDPADARAQLSTTLPPALVPLVVPLHELPCKASGKVDRDALPWPPPAPVSGAASASEGEGDLADSGEQRELEAWLVERWQEQLGPVPVSRQSDFFELGGTSLSVARLVSVLRRRFPMAAVADVYNHHRLGQLAARLRQLDDAVEAQGTTRPPRRRWGALRLLGVLALVALSSVQWLLGVLAYNQWFHVGPQIGWLALAAGWLAVSSAPGRAGIVVAARRALVARVRPGRSPREGWLAARIWFVERLAQSLRVDVLAGTPWAARYARLMGAAVGPGARLGTLPPPVSLLEVGEGATIEGDVDLHGWWIDGAELVIGEVRVGAWSSVGTRSVLMPGATIGEGAEIEPGTVVTGPVPPRQCWSGSPGLSRGVAGRRWADSHSELVEGQPAPNVLYSFGIAMVSLLPVLAAVPGLGIATAWGSLGSVHQAAQTILTLAPVLALSYLASYALLVVVAVRGVARFIRPGLHPDRSRTAWAVWFTNMLTARTRLVLFPLYATVFTRWWLRALGVRVGRRTEVSTAVGLNHLMRIGETSFVADDVVFAGTRGRAGWVEVAPVAVGDRSFLGNSAILEEGSRLGDDCLVGVLSSPPRDAADGTSWLGTPAIELPRVPEEVDASRTTSPPRRLVLARAAVEAFRIVSPTTVGAVLGFLVFAFVESIGLHHGGLCMVAATPLALLAGRLGAVLCTIAVKWALIGRYRPGKHPLWSSFVWRDEVVNSFHEQLAGAWLLGDAVGTPLLPLYIRAMGGKAGRGVWFESLNVTEFDLVDLGEGSVVNRGAVVETHLFHDRMFRTGQATLGRGATLGPHSAALPETTLGADCTVGARSVVLRGEGLPPRTRWHGTPVECAG